MDISSLLPRIAVVFNDDLCSDTRLSLWSTVLAVGSFGRIGIPTRGILYCRDVRVPYNSNLLLAVFAKSPGAHAADEV